MLGMVRRSFDPAAAARGRARHLHRFAPEPRGARAARARPGRRSGSRASSRTCRGPASGHWYFSLKDEDAQVRCAMFRQRNLAGAFAPADGMQVLVRGRVSLYEARGEFQLVVDHIEEAGEGALRTALRGAQGEARGRGPVRRRAQAPAAALAPADRRRHLADRRGDPRRPAHPAAALSGDPPC